MADPIPNPGRVKEITAVSNPVIKAVKALHLKKNRDAEGTFLVEGLKLITDAIDGGWECQTLIYAKSYRENSHLQKIAASVRTAGCDILEVSEKVLSSITKRDNPQMVVGVMHQRWRDPQSIKPLNGEVWVALDRVRDPGNLGTIMRTIDAVGARGVLLVGDTTDPYSVEAVRATMGSVFNVEISRLTADEFSDFTKKWPGISVGTHLSATSDFRELNVGDLPVLLVMGNEQQGLPDEMAEQCDKLAIIPMAGKADSLNLAISTGIMLFELRREFLKCS